MWERANPTHGALLLAAMFAIALTQSALALDWDRLLPLWDKAVHFGAAGGLAIIVSHHERRAQARFAIVMGFAIAWELAQAAYEGIAASASPSYVVDTIADLIADALGAAALGWPLGRASRAASLVSHES